MHLTLTYLVLAYSVIYWHLSGNNYNSSDITEYSETQILTDSGMQKSLIE